MRVFSTGRLLGPCSEIKGFFLILGNFLDLFRFNPEYKMTPISSEPVVTIDDVWKIQFNLPNKKLLLNFSQAQIVPQPL